MNCTVDANIFFAALAKNSATRRLWFFQELTLYSPIFLLNEFQKYKSYLFKKYSGTQEEFETLTNDLLSQLRFVSYDALKPFLPAASSLIMDSQDWLYLACALKEDTVIWSNDQGFKKQNRVKVYTTTEMMREFGLL